MVSEDLLTFRGHKRSNLRWLPIVNWPLWWKLTMCLISCFYPKVHKNAFLKGLALSLYTPTKLGEEHWLQQTGSQNATGENGSIHRYFFRFPLQGMHGNCCHNIVFLIRPTPTHNNTLQAILKISIFWFVDPTLKLDRAGNRM